MGVLTADFGCECHHHGFRGDEPASQAQVGSHSLRIDMQTGHRLLSLRKR
jgi:hypothetical protein